MDLHFRLAAGPSRFFDGRYPRHTVNYDNSISPYPMTSGEAFAFRGSRWYWDGQDIVHVNSYTWDFVRFTRETIRPETNRESDLVSIPGGPTILRERDDSGLVRTIRGYSSAGSLLASVSFDPSGVALQADLYEEKRLKKKRYFYASGRIRAEDNYSTYGFRESRLEWDEEGHLISAKDRADEAFDEILEWLGWR